MSAAAVIWSALLAGVAGIGWMVRDARGWVRRGGAAVAGNNGAPWLLYVRPASGGAGVELVYMQAGDDGAVILPMTDEFALELGCDLVGQAGANRRAERRSQAGSLRAASPVPTLDEFHFPDDDGGR